MHLGRAHRTQIYKSDCCLPLRLRTRSAEETMLLKKQQQLGQQVFPCFMFFFQTNRYSQSRFSDFFFSPSRLKPNFVFSAELPLYCQPYFACYNEVRQRYYWSLTKMEPILDY